MFGDRIYDHARGSPQRAVVHVDPVWRDEELPADHTPERLVVGCSARSKL
jgi:hypothetical protein